MARILLHSLVFVPDGVSTAYLMTDLARGLVGRGHEVTVLTAVPHYNPEPAALEKIPLQRVGRGVYRAHIDGVDVWYVHVAPRAKQLWRRVADFIAFHVRSIRVAYTRIGRFDIVFAPSPPLTMGIMTWLIARRFSVPSIYNVQELYPDFAINNGFIRRRPVIAALRVLERLVYALNSMIVTISPRFEAVLRARRVPALKLRTIPNFVDAEFYRPLSRSNEFSRQHGLEDRFVVMYGGNIGLSQDWEMLLRAADLLRSEGVTFVITGNGVLSAWLAEQVKARGLTNVQLHGYLPLDVIPWVYASADIGIIPMKQGTSRDTFPSKVYVYLSCAKPPLAVADPDSELEATVLASGCGRVVPPGDLESLVQQIRGACRDRAKLGAEGLRGRQYVVEHFSKEAVVAQYDGLISEMVDSKVRAAGR